MKISGISLAITIALASVAPLSPVHAADRDARIKQCVSDNKDEKQTPEAVSSYCSCMTDKMPSSETSSVTEWESSHQPEQDSCATGANWKFD